MDKTREIEKGKNKIESVFFRQRCQAVDASMNDRRKHCKSTAFFMRKRSNSLQVKPIKIIIFVVLGQLK